MLFLYSRYSCNVGPDTNWVCTIKVIRDPDSGTDKKPGEYQADQNTSKISTYGQNHLCSLFYSYSEE